MSSPAQGEPVTTPHEASSALVRLCLPSAMSDDTRKLAYACSICALFLIIGAIGLKAPIVPRHEVAAPNDTVPVIFTPPDAPPPPPEEVRPDDSNLSDTPPESAQVVTVVAPSTADVAFAIPVQGNVVVAASPQFVSGPPANGGSSGSRSGNGPVGPVVFNGAGDSSGNYPYPDWPIEERKLRHTGNLMLNAVIAEDGSFEKLEVLDSSGFNSLDRHTLNHVKRNWHFPPGPRREYHIPFEYKFE